VPVLRLPDFIAEPVRSRRSITVVLCADHGPDDPDRQAATVIRLAATIAGAIPLPATVHIFATAALHDRLRSKRSPVEWADRVLLHDPAADHAAGDWPAWVRAAMGGESADVVHFLAPAVTRLEGALLLSGSPADPADTGRTAMPTAELTRFTLQLGAWACVFTSPERNPSEMGLRQLATTVAGLRPATVLHHELRLDPDLTALRDAYRLVTGPEPGWPPRDPAIALCCQPFQVITEPRRDELLRAAEPVAEPTDRVRAMLADVGSPAWMSAAQRYVEQYEWRLSQWREPDRAPAPDPLAAGVTEALGQIQGVLDRYAGAPTVPVPPPAVADLSDAPVPRADR
jgi:hypothetical protein